MQFRQISVYHNDLYNRSNLQLAWICMLHPRTENPLSLSRLRHTKKCDSDAEPECEGSPYQTNQQLKCQYHWLAKVLECGKRTEEANSVIHPTMGRGHSNLCKAGFTVLPHFSAKSQSLCRYGFFFCWY